MNYSQLVNSYLTAQDDFPLPEGERYPPFPNGYDQSGEYDDLYGEVLVFGIYECAWETQWLSTRSSSGSDASKALTVLDGIPDNGVFKQTFDESAQLTIRDAYEKADLGDPSGVQSLVAAEIC
jgi:hypothetical protein